MKRLSIIALSAAMMLFAISASAKTYALEDLTGAWEFFASQNEDGTINEIHAEFIINPDGTFEKNQLATMTGGFNGQEFTYKVVSRSSGTYTFNGKALKLKTDPDSIVMEDQTGDMPLFMRALIGTIRESMRYDILRREKYVVKYLSEDEVIFRYVDTGLAAGAGDNLFSKQLYIRKAVQQ